MFINNFIQVEKRKNFVNMFFVHLTMIVQAILVGENLLIFYKRQKIFILDFSEFLIAISITAQQEPKKKLEWAFSMYGMY